jgi:ligand-binding sensor domain-containing protein
MINPLYAVVVLMFMIHSCQWKIKPESHFITEKNHTQEVHPISGRTKGINPNIKITCGLQDMTGNMWVGTSGDGVYRYDGQSFVHFTVKDGLSHNHVLTMLLDKRGNIWFGTSGGVCSFDGSIFTGLPFPLQDAEMAKPGFYTRGIPGRQVPVFSILQDQRDVMWFGTGDGLFRYQVERQKGCSMVVKPGFPARYLSDKDGCSIGPQSINSLYEDKKGNLWISSQSCGLTYRVDRDRLEHPCLNTTCHHHLLMPEDLAAHESEIKKSFVVPKSLDGGSFSFRSVAEDGSGLIWFDTFDRGVYRYDPVSGLSASQKKDSVYIAPKMRGGKGIMESLVNVIKQDGC